MKQSALHLKIKRLFIWLLHFQHRRGYGVQSPFAYNLITRVIYEKTPYYAYETLRKKELEEVKVQGKEWLDNSLKLRRLLFRLVNDVQPSTIINMGKEYASSLYMKSACPHAEYYNYEELPLDYYKKTPVFLYIHQTTSITDILINYQHICNVCDEDTVIVIHGIGYNKQMQTLWKYMIQQKKATVTFDLYDMGIIIFNSSLSEHHYIVNF